MRTIRENAMKKRPPQHASLAIPALAGLTLLVFASSAMAGSSSKHRFSGWKAAKPVIEVNDNMAAEGCPIESRDGLSLFIASNRPSEQTQDDGVPRNDIWVSDRENKYAPFSEPENLNVPVNSGGNDFCPTPLDHRWLMFVSDRLGTETCNPNGSGDMYLVRQNAGSGWGEPQHLGCIETGTGPNSAGAEFSPSLVTTKRGTFLYFSSNVSGNMDIYVSRRGPGGVFGPPSPVHELNTEYDDRMPNVSSDGLEIVFSSDRPVDAKGKRNFGKETFDVYVSTRSSTNGRWSGPRNAGRNVNSSSSEFRPSLSWDRKRMYFGRDGDIWSTYRKEKKHQKPQKHH